MNLGNKGEHIPTNQQSMKRHLLWTSYNSMIYAKCNYG